ncbi:hypothetical protein QR97_31695 [Streptomyces sp. PBH53]|nr:hypothetical protein QR97_31695 [Streptomyces sp. PBH53]
MLHVLADCLEDDFRLIQALDGARYHGGELFGLPDEFGVLVEAITAAEIVGGDAGSSAPRTWHARCLPPPSSARAWP